jgi:hypothetical protein
MHRSWKEATSHSKEITMILLVKAIVQLLQRRQARRAAR